MFAWNEFLTRGIRNLLKNTLWTVALVYGFFKQMSSAAGKTPAPSQALYSASKFALSGYFNTLCSEKRVFRKKARRADNNCCNTWIEGSLDILLGQTFKIREGLYVDPHCQTISSLCWCQVHSIWCYQISTNKKLFFSERRGHWKATTQSQEFLRTLQRYYNNAYMDAEKQYAINVVNLNSLHWMTSS